METVGAGIGLAETTLVLDPNGAYRAAQVLRVDNSTEQFWRFGCPRAPSCGRPAWRASRSSPLRSRGAADPPVWIR